MDFTGIYSPYDEESPLWDANKALIHYCSSDYYMGDLRGKKLWGYQFEGQKIVDAFITELVEKRGLGKSGRQELLVFGGISSGAVGAIAHIDKVAAKLKSHNVKVLGFFDSPMYFKDVEPLYKN